MNKDIKVLENFIDKQKSNKGTFVPTDFEITAIENLIKRNKELEEIFKQFNAIHKDKIFVKEIPYELIIADTRYFMSGTFYDNFISKSKVKEKIEEYNKMINATYGDLTLLGDIRRDNCIEIKNVLLELLEERV